MAKAGAALLVLWAVVATLSWLDVFERWDELKPLTRGTKAPDVALFEIDGSGRAGPKRALSDFRGQVLVLDFWATWCGPCRRSMPAIHQFATEYEGRVQVISINTEAYNRSGAARRMANQLIPGILLLSDGERAATEAYGALTIPFLVVVDQSGVVAATHRGFSSAEALIERLRDDVDPLL